MSSIIEESKNAKSKSYFGFLLNKKFLIGLIIVIVLGGLYNFTNKDSKQTDKVVVAKEWTVKIDDIVVSVESDGNVVAEDGVELSFGVSDDNLEVKEVFVKEGDEVKKGDKIALAETDSLQLNVNNAWSSYQSTLADYNETMEGPTDNEIEDGKDDVKSAEISLDQAEISVANIKQNAEQSIYDAEQRVKDAKEDMDENSNINDSEDVRDVYRDIIDVLKTISFLLETDLSESDDILGIDNVRINDDFENSLGVKKLNSLNNANASYISTRDLKEEFELKILGLSYSSGYETIDEVTELASAALTEMEKHLYDMQLMLNASITSLNFSQSNLDSFKSIINNNRSAVNSKITSLDSEIIKLEDTKDGLDDYRDTYEDMVRDLDIAKDEAERDIANAEASLESRELSLERAKRNYEELIAPMTAAEIASARSRLTSSSVSLQKAKNELDKATITAPIDGQMVELNYKVGDIIVDDNDPVAVILNSETLFIKVYVEEADVSELSVGQKAIATFDALDELELKGEISFISLTSNTSNNGVVTYEVRVLINNPSEKQIREGMTAGINFVAREARDILTIPVSAVSNVGGNPSVQLKETGEWTKVTTGFTDGKYVEVIAGVNEGDILLY